MTEEDLLDLAKRINRDTANLEDHVHWWRVAEWAALQRVKVAAKRLLRVVVLLQDLHEKREK